MHSIEWLPPIRTITSHPAFRRALKTHFSKLAFFPDFIHSIHLVYVLCIDYVMRSRSIFARMRTINSFSARCNIYISRLCYDVSVRLSVRLSVTEMHWRIIANLGFKFRSHFTAHCGRRAACGRIISRHASHC